jgi:RNA polymerase sigma-70 factor, ECF subfamily
MSASVAQALELIRENRPESINQALELLQNTVYSFSMKVCGHPEDAEDTMQEVLVKSVPHLSKFEDARALAVWLYKVARNRCISKRRGDKNSKAKNLSLDQLMPDGRELRELLSNLPGPEAAALSNEAAERVRQAVLSLPPQYRLVLVLHDMEELSTSEVAQITGLREGTVRVRLHRARLFVRRELARLAKPVGRHELDVQAPAFAMGPRPPRCRVLFAALSDYMDGVVDDPLCDEMDRHLKDCEPCQAFVASLKQAVAQCRSYHPQCGPRRASELRQELLLKYQAARAALDRVRRLALPR